MPPSVNDGSRTSYQVILGIVVQHICVIPRRRSTGMRRATVLMIPSVFASSPRRVPVIAVGLMCACLAGVACSSGTAADAGGGGGRGGRGGGGAQPVVVATVGQKDVP